MACEYCGEKFENDDDLVEAVCGCIFCYSCFEDVYNLHCPHCALPLLEASQLPAHVGKVQEIAEDQKQKLDQLTDELANKESSPRVSALLAGIAANNQEIEKELSILKKEAKEEPKKYLKKLY